MTTADDRYGPDVLAADAQRRKAGLPLLPAELGLIVEDPTSKYVGELIAIGKDAFTLEDNQGRQRLFDWLSAFAVEGRLVRLVPPTPAVVAPARAIRSASGSVYVTGHQARVAQVSRILVEGRHDAEMVEKVWGHDLRVEGVVVELLDGADNLPAFVKAFRPGPGRRLGVLLDHLTLGSKESRVAAAVSGRHVLVTGHPFVDVWQAVRPEVLGIDAWPAIPRSTEWKQGICAALGWGSPQEAWPRILGAVSSWHDLEPELIRSVEALVDFVTAPHES